MSTVKSCYVVVYGQAVTSRPTITDYLTRQEAADRLSVSVLTIDRWVAKGTLGSYRRPGRREVALDPVEVDRLDRFEPRTQEEEDLELRARVLKMIDQVPQRLRDVHNVYRRPAERELLSRLETEGRISRLRDGRTQRYLGHGPNSPLEFVNSFASRYQHEPARNLEQERAGAQLLAFYAHYANWCARLGVAPISDNSFEMWGDVLWGGWYTDQRYASLEGRLHSRELTGPEL